MGNKTNDEAIEVVWGLLGTISVKKYLREKPTKAKDTEYIVINALPISVGPMQKCIVNVNYHVKDIEAGIADHIKLVSGAQALFNILERVTAPSYMIDLESQHTYQEMGLDEHFSNSRLSFKFVNK